MPVALITGASSGIGLALAKEYARRYHLILLARRLERLETLRAEILRELPSCQILIVKTDVRREADIKHAVDEGLERFGSIDVVVANAGIGMGGALENLTPQNYRDLFETNIFGVLHTIYATLPALKVSRGRLAVLGSVMSYVAMPDSSAYSMSKAAVKSLCEALRFELTPAGVSVTLLCPGLVESEISRKDRDGVFHADREDPSPAFLRMPAPRAARAMARGIEARRAECIITAHGKGIVFLQRHAPILMRALLARRFQK